MNRPWTYLNQHERDTFRATTAFIHKRLAEQGTVDWALRLKPDQRIEKIAIEDLLKSQGTPILQEPWATAWRLIEESWSSDFPLSGYETSIYHIQKRLRAGDRSGAVIASIVNLVAPRLKVEPARYPHSPSNKKSKRPLSLEDLISAGLTSGKLIDLNILELSNLTDMVFLKSLANALDAAITHGLDIARRIGWDGQQRLWQLGNLARVYYVGEPSQSSRSQDPDAYRVGIAPSVKLLHAVMTKIITLAPDVALPFMSRWVRLDNPIHVRLWAAVARNPLLVSAAEIGLFLLKLDDRKFWDLNAFPEIAEVRAVRFQGLIKEDKEAVAKRVRKGPPRDHWPKKAEPEKVKNARLRWAVRELRRIEVAGGDLPERSKSWLVAHAGLFPDFDTITLHEGFQRLETIQSTLNMADDRYDTLDGVPRLQALEAALSSSRGGWDDDPAERANDWLSEPEKANLVISDLETSRNGGDDFAQLWNRFGWAHSPPLPEGTETTMREPHAEATRVLSLLNQLSEGTLSAAIEGITAWLDRWKQQIVAMPLGLAVWRRVWPIAVKITNTRPENGNQNDLSATARSDDENRETMDLDTLNTPAGRLVGVFLAACPPLPDNPNAFVTGSVEQQMRDIAIASHGRAGLIVRHRMIEFLPYFLRATPKWTREYLITPLLTDDGQSLALWRAIARRTHFTEVLKILGGAMAERATDRRLGRETRQSLVFSIVVESLHAFRENRSPAIPNPRVQQMLRTLDDEVRASAANAIQQFIRELSEKGEKEGEEPTSAAELFRSAASPFLREVWPQERSLSTPGVSGAFADLPATSEQAFTEAVDAIARFLVPFECWSMLEYGLYNDDDAKKLSLIDDDTKAGALLRLLDLTVGTSEGSVVPFDLTDALEQIRKIAPALTNAPAFRRLSTSARR